MPVIDIGSDTLIDNNGSYTIPVGADTLLVKVFASVDAPNDDGLGGVAIITLGDGGSSVGITDAVSVYDTNANPDSFTAQGIFTLAQFAPYTNVTIGVTLGGTIVTTNEVALVICARAGVDQALPFVLGTPTENETSFGTTFQADVLNTIDEGKAEYAIGRAATNISLTSPGLAIDVLDDTLTDLRAFAISGVTTTSTIEPLFTGGSNGSWAITGVALNPATVVVTAPSIGVISDATPNNGDSIDLTGSDFGASANTVILSPTDNVDDVSAVTQTITAESVSSISFTLDKGSLNFDSNLYVFVRRSDNASNANGTVLQVIPIVSIRDTFLSLLNVTADSQTGLNVFVWKSVPAGNPDQILLSQSLDGSGDSLWAITQESLNANTPDPIWIAVFAGDGSFLGSAAKITPDYR